MLAWVALCSLALQMVKAMALEGAFRERSHLNGWSSFVSSGHGSLGGVVSQVGLLWAIYAMGL